MHFGIAALNDLHTSFLGIEGIFQHIGQHGGVLVVALLLRWCSIWTVFRMVDIHVPLFNVSARAYL